MTQEKDQDSAKVSLEAMSEAFDSARKHFDDNKGKNEP